MDSDSESEDLLLDDQEGFDDFTVASSWERLISDIEVSCRKWQVASSKGYLATEAAVVEGDGKLHQVHSVLTHGTKNYRLDFFFELDGHGSTDDWKEDLHHLQLWFGVHDFLVIAPISMSGVILDAPEATFLLSAVAIALSNCGSIWPAFVPVHDPTRKSYKGIQAMKGPYSRSFEADRIGSQVPVKLMHLEGLYDLFITKLAFSLLDFDSNYDGKVRLTMRLIYRTPMPGFECVQTEDAVSPSVKAVPNYEGDITGKAPWDDKCPWAEWYSVDDPIKGFELITIWASRTVESSLDMAEFENVSTFEADKWLLAPIIAKNLGDGTQDEQVSFASRILALVTAFSFTKDAKFMEDFSTGDSAILQNVTSSTIIPPPGVLDRVLRDLFQDAMPRAAFGDRETFHENARSIKGAPTDSLFAQFCLQALWFGSCNIRAISVLWLEFVREVRWCWEELQPLPKIPADESPDFDACLVYQKLQLLTACIKRKAAEQHLCDRRKKVDTSANVDVESEYSTATGGDFSGFPNPDTDRIDVYSHEESRGAESDKLLLKSYQRLHVPTTQEPPVMTEDMVIEREKAMVALGDSPSGKATQAWLQTDILSSDMAAFKAANPDAVLEDFIRWHSPRDWIENDESINSPENSGYGGQGNDREKTRERPWPPRGKLSERMSHPGNMWERIWRTVEPAPASEQKLLFDHTREGEKVIHYLETLRPHQLLAQMICTCFGAVADILYKTKIGNLRSLQTDIDKVFLTISSVLKPLTSFNLSDTMFAENLEDWHTDLMNLCALLEKTEKHVIMAASLYQKLPNAPRLYTAISNNYIKLQRVEKPHLIVNLQQLVSMSERDTVANLFPPLSSTETWKKSLRMGNFLNGHEPSVREIIFSHFDHYSKGQRERYRMDNSSTREHILSHRMYIQGTSNDVQVAYSVISDD